MVTKEKSSVSLRGSDGSFPLADRLHSASRRMSAFGLMFILVLALMVAAYIFSSTDSIAACDKTLSAESGAPAGLCLKPLVVALSSSNSSFFFYVPVVVVRPGTTATVDILYQQTANHTAPVSGSGSLPVPPQLRPEDVPQVLSVPGGQLMGVRQITFSTGQLLSQHGKWTLY